ncbi:MAG TPA: spore protease YyaC [Bacillota bacterium]|nr:spore protease YyaC [Bacillota bacterium]
MWNTLSKKKPENSDSYQPNYRIHIDQTLAVQTFQKNFGLLLSQLYVPSSELIILCIGTDRSTGDSLGPLIGSKLIALGLESDNVYGTLDNPVHAVNLHSTIEEIFAKHHNPFIVAIDACLGRSESIGYISLKEGPLQPGTGVNKNLPAIGDLQIVGIVNVGGFMEYMVLQNTRLSLVMKMADIISQGIYWEIMQQDQTCNELLLTPDFPVTLEPLHP